MKLTDAMMLGRVTVQKMMAQDIDSCALGVAGNAVGIPSARRLVVEGGDIWSRANAIAKRWPWITERCTCGAKHCGATVGHCIATRFNMQVAPSTHRIHTFHYAMFPELRGRMTFEELVDWVRSIEPKELMAPKEEAPRWEPAPVVEEELVAV